MAAKNRNLKFSRGVVGWWSGGPSLNIVVQEVTSVGFTFLFSLEFDGDYYVAVFVDS